MIFLGVDPGLDGYLARVSPGGVDFYPIPTIGGKGARREYDRGAILALFAAIARDAGATGRLFCVIERQQAMGRGSTGTAFKTGLGYGYLTMALAAAEIPFDEVSPATWKKEARIVGQGASAKARKSDSKRRAIERAQSLFPGVELKRTPACRVPSHDKAEALLLADFARRSR